MNTKLVEAIFEHFELNQWKRSGGLRKMTLFDRWTAQEVQTHIAAMVRLGILEKREASATTNAVYRLTAIRAHWWKQMFEHALETTVLPQGMDFRTLYILYVIGTFQLEHQRPPRQIELIYKGEEGRYNGLINEWLESSGASTEDPVGIAGAPHIHQAALRLAEMGYMVERGAKGEKRPYLLTEKGIAVVKQLQALRWQDWPIFKE